MVDKKPVGFVILFAVAAQGRGYSLTLLTRIDENQAFFTSCMLKNIFKTRIGFFGSTVRGFVKTRHGTVGQAVIGRIIFG